MLQRPEDGSAKALGGSRSKSAATPRQARL